MKTKSKRFLNLATLCLALLGTTLLMAHPVKAEIVMPQEHTRNSSGENGKGSEETADQELDPYGHSRKLGEEDGYNAGKRASIYESGVDREKIVVPRDRDIKDDVGYKDGYEYGYGQGWEEEHPFQAALNWLWGIVSGLLGLSNGYQQSN
ncbi:Uncharacterised protein [Streptococcus pyogenes]|uniref:hypothetical protein n=1 Tax=Streptococcus pyogenes TaxID=1314 RepID=UPI0010A0D6B8|nr:hypothetical protein [Streptococcus pyogenes]VGR67863.1 hypothetical membrane associated protein [Streptococcus pyogenes]VHE70730.1 Uncharacterised protein [Streptococcus pyogenes]VHE89987.1 Uncharacterised protein [Streptococcus pyogenes]VHG74511.1 Uncharacterised protein [Streptococcus pyogenes]